MSGGPRGRDWSSGLTPLVVFALLTAMFAGLGPALDTRMVQLGERIWPQYAAELRSDPQPVPEECDLEALDKRLEACPPEGAAVVAPQFAVKVICLGLAGQRREQQARAQQGGGSRSAAAGTGRSSGRSGHGTPL